MPDINLDNVGMLAPELQRIYAKALQAERKPIESAEERKSNIDEKLKLLNDVIGKVDGVRKQVTTVSTPMAFKELNVVSSDGTVLSGVADKSVAEFGKHSLEIKGLAAEARALSNRFPDRDSTQIGSGYFTFRGPDGDTQELFIDNENATLDGVARLINSSRVGVKASVVEDQADPENPFRLILSSEKTGASQTIDYPELYFVDGDSDFYMDDERNPRNAVVQYQGFQVENEKNEIDSLIRGVTLNLKGTSAPGREVSISIEQDIPKTTEKMKGLVDGLNQVLGFIQQQNTLDKDSKTAKTLGGDYGIRMAEIRVRDAIQGSIQDAGANAHIRTFSDLGISFNKKGTLEFDQKKFETAVTAHYDEVVSIVTGSNNGNGLNPGLAGRLSRALTSITTPGSGLLSNQRSSLQTRIERANADIQVKEKAFERKAEVLRSKLAAAQGAMEKMRSQGAALNGAVGTPSLLPRG